MRGQQFLSVLDTRTSKGKVTAENGGEKNLDLLEKNTCSEGL